MTRPARPSRQPLAGAVLALFWTLTTVGAGAWSPAVAAGTDASIDYAVPTEGAVRLLVSVPGADDVDLAGVKVTIGGKVVDAETSAASASSTVERTSILAIDTSASMAGKRITEARRAALAYLASVPANVQVGVLSFDDDVTLEVAPTLDRDAARTAIARLRLTRDTLLYDGVLGALDAVGPGGAKAGQRKILLLSDGKDTTRTPLGKVLASIKRSGAGVDVVSLQRGDEANKPLNAIAGAGRGSILTAADPAALSAAFSREATKLARQIVVTAQLPRGLTGTSSNVAVSVPTATASYDAAAYVPVRVAQEKTAVEAEEALPRPVAAGPLDVSTRLVYGAVAAIGAGLLGIISLLGLSTRKTPSCGDLTQQIRAYGVLPGQPGQPGQRAAQGNPFGGQARQAAEKALATNADLEVRIARSLEAAGLALKPAEWLLLRGAIAVGGGLLALLLGSGSIILGALVVVTALAGPWLYLRIKRGKRLKAFSQGLADTLQLMSGSLSAGLSLGQSIDTIVREGADPISSEFRRVVVESRLGVTLEDSLEGVGERMESRDFAWVVMAIRIQREVGGNLAELLLTVAATLREREYLRRHVRALSAEGRLSAYILGGLPPVFLVYLTLTKPDYVQPLYTTPIGWLLCLVMAVLLTVGVFWMSKVAKVDV